MGSIEVAKPLRVLIIGAGSAGLFMAQALKKANISCTVFEKDSSLTQRPRDWNFGLYWAQSLLDTCLPKDVRARIKDAETDPTYESGEHSVMPAYHAHTGELLKDFPAPMSMRLRRKKLMEVLGSGIDIRWDAAPIRIDDNGTSVTLHFATNGPETGDLIIGAEGAHSPTRDYLLGQDVAKMVDLDYVASYALTTLSKETSEALRKLHPRYTAQVDPRGCYAFIAVHNTEAAEPAEYVWLLTQSWISPADTGLRGPAVIANMKERAQAFASPFREAYLAMPDDAPCWHSRMSNWPTKPWDSRGGRITLIGDAAHPMTIHRGQGLQNGIMDAHVLYQNICEMKTPSSKELGAAVQKYEQEMWPRGEEAVIGSFENTRLLHDWETIFQSPLFRGGMARNVGQD